MKPAIESILPYTSRIVTDCVTADKLALNVATESITHNFSLLLRDLTNSFKTTITAGTYVAKLPNVDPSFDFIEKRNMQIPCISTMTGFYVHVCKDLNQAIKDLQTLPQELTALHVYLAGVVSKPERYLSSNPQLKQAAPVSIDALTGHFQGKSRVTDKITNLFRTEGEIRETIALHNETSDVMAGIGLNQVAATVTKIAQLTEQIQKDSERYNFSNNAVAAMSAELYALGVKVQQLGIVRSLAEDMYSVLTRCLKVMKK